MKISPSRGRKGFTLMETVIAIGVLAVLLTAFMAVFGPAAQQLRRALSVQEADRLVSSLDHEMTTVHSNEGSQYSSGFDKAYNWLTDASKSNKAVLLYQYRGNPDKLRSDGSMDPYTVYGGIAGKDFVVQPMVRQRDDTLLKDDFAALDGPVYCVKMTELVFNGGHMEENSGSGDIAPLDSTDPNASSVVGAGSDGYPNAVLAFQSDFYLLPNSSLEYVQSGGKFDPAKLTKPLFSNNMAVRR